MADRWARVSGAERLDLLRRFLAGNQSAEPAMKAIISAADAGHYDADFASNPDPEIMHVTTSYHLMVLALLHRLQGLSTAQFYKEYPLRYVRMKCLVPRMLGYKRLTMGWPVYGFGAESLARSR